jgi:transcriptional antiterminator
LLNQTTEQEIAEKLGVDNSTISRDIKVLKQLSQRFVYDLTHSDLAYYYKQCLNGIEEAKRRAWACYNRLTAEPLDKPGVVKDSLLALNQFSLFKEGPAIMQIRKLEERLAHIESRERTQELRKEMV